MVATTETAILARIANVSQTSTWLISILNKQGYGQKIPERIYIIVIKLMDYALDAGTRQPTDCYARNIILLEKSNLKDIGQKLLFSKLKATNYAAPAEKHQNLMTIRSAKHATTVCLRLQNMPGASLIEKTISGAKLILLKQCLNVDS